MTPCQGSFFLRKYTIIYPIDSISSLRLCSPPRNALIDANLTVPVNFPVKPNLICLLVVEDLYFLLKPKSIKYITLGSFNPIKKLSGLISL